MKILIVEDERLLADSLKTLLEKKSFQVETAYDGQSGAECAGLGVYDLLILDVMMPGLDGFALARRVRAQRCGVPILMLTARSALEDRVRGLDAGADYYLTKPFDTPENLEKQLLAPSEVALTIQATPAETERLLAGVPDAGRIEIQGEEEGRTSVLLHAGTEDLYRLCGDIFLACAENNVVLLELTPRRASLEDVFLELNAGQPEAPAADEDKEAMS